MGDNVGKLQPRKNIGNANQGVGKNAIRWRQPGQIIAYGDADSFLCAQRWSKTSWHKCPAFNCERILTHSSRNGGAKTLGLGESKGGLSLP